MKTSMPMDVEGALVLLVEDQRETAQLLSDRLAHRGYAVDYAGDGASALRLLSNDTAQYDVVVLDLMLPDMDGIEVCRRMREELHCLAPVLMLSARDDIEDRLDGFENGADDYLAKPFDMRELEVRVRALIRRSRHQMPGSVYTVSDMVLDTGTMQLTRGGHRLTLPPIGMKLLAILMRESPRVVSRRDIEREIWGDQMPDSDTLRSHLYNLRKVIDKPFDEPLLHTIHSSGYRLADLRAPVRV